MAIGFLPQELISSYMNQFISVCGKDWGSYFHLKTPQLTIIYYDKCMVYFHIYHRIFLYKCSLQSNTCLAQSMFRSLLLNDYKMTTFYRMTFYVICASSGQTYEFRLNLLIYMIYHM